ncbi:ribonuclease P protein component [Laspinema sp. A4]|uniref:ribonuclease P protein component n=1 Tax=Laspinema sp. D2d TaxID=2953686 RepID=UPI0021BB56C4|nr:ribonuclease P protein component [Laspinema sp. D2d]MCT7984649.1 ribonuclease P protein component [Laspinema sp. D2d]
MLPASNRLKRPKEFSAVYRTGISRKTSHLTLRAKRRKGVLPVGKQLDLGAENLPEALTANQPTRVGISISLKVSKKAVIRNRIKRQIRAGLREFLPRISQGWDLVFIVRPSAVECNYRQLLQELEQLLAQAEVLNGDSRGSLL